MYITCNIHQSIVLEVMDEEYMSRFIPILSYIAVTSISKAIIYVAEAPPKKKKNQTLHSAGAMSHSSVSLTLQTFFKTKKVINI